MEPFLVANDLDCNQRALAMIDATDNLTETSLPENVDDLVSIREMVSRYNVVVPTVVVVAIVGLLGLEVAHNLARILGPTEVDVGIIYDFPPLVDVEDGDADSFVRV